MRRGVPVLRWAVTLHQQHSSHLPTTPAIIGTLVIIGIFQQEKELNSGNYDGHSTVKVIKSSSFYLPTKIVFIACLICGSML